MIKNIIITCLSLAGMIGALMNRFDIATCMFATISFIVFLFGYKGLFQFDIPTTTQINIDTTKDLKEVQ
jgi:hypothetical protein